MLYVIHAYDYTDNHALDRRMAIRANHFDGARELNAKGHFVMGGALLNPNGKMIGSMMVLDFENETQMQEWYDAEPYIANKIWEKIDIKPFKKADI
jgi:uncharacterized protein